MTRSTLRTSTHAILTSVVIFVTVGAVHAQGNQFASTPQDIRVSLKRAILSIEKEFGDQYDGEGFLKRLEKVSPKDLKGMTSLQREALLANPALDFEDMLVIKRGGNRLGLRGGNYNSIARTRRSGWTTDIMRVKGIKSPQPKQVSLYRPKHKGLVIDVDLHFDGEKIAFAMPHPENNAYRLYEMKLGTGKPVQITPEDGKDVDHSDPCYLPDGAFVFASTATFLGMPCINGGPRMASLYRLEKDRKTIRQLGFDQDTSWYPTLMHDGRVMYTRWDYSDMVHSNNRPLMVMNPDGTGQRSISFSNSYFPASFFFARPIPGHSSQVVGVITGHHGPARVGRMIITDPAISGHEEKGMVQEIPGYGKKVKRVVKDPLIHNVWPRMLHPFPVAQSKTHKGGGKFFVVSMQINSKSRWGIYLVDIFDNAICLVQQDKCGFFEPIPLKKQPSPPIIPSFVKPKSDKATLYIQNVYHGPGLKDVPRGVIKKLRIGSYQFSANGNGGHWGTIGVDSGWDIKTIVGVAPVNEDGSVTAEIPSKTPLFFQPLDAKGRALQGMRSWSSAQGGERLSCLGCHESPNDMPRPQPTKASLQAPRPLVKWLGPQRPLSFPHEIQPILDANCISCHDGGPAKGRYKTHRPEFRNGGIPDLRGIPITDYKRIRAGGSASASYGGQFTKSYVTLHSLTRHPGIESPMHVPNPGEYGAISSELSDILNKGHYGVNLSSEEMLKLQTWMDYNAPFHGYRRNITNSGRYEKGRKTVENAFKRGNELSQKYASQDNFIHIVPPALPKPRTKAIPDQQVFESIRLKQVAIVTPSIGERKKKTKTISLGKGLDIQLVHIPSGAFNMGSNQESPAEAPKHGVSIKKGFWMATKEITNAQLRLFRADHDAKFEDRLGYQFGQECYPVNGDTLPAVRVSWTTAKAFCDWLSKKTKMTVRLPNEAQWEWAARAGKNTPFWFGAQDADFGKFANLSDKSMEQFADNTASGRPKYTGISKIKSPTRYEMWIPYVKSVNDGQQLQCAPGKYQANPWGLFDMHGNVAEWTRTEYHAYPFTQKENTGNQALKTMVVRGGSYRDRPYRATSSYRRLHDGWHKVHDVGFRIIIEE